MAPAAGYKLEREKNRREKKLDGNKQIWAATKFVPCDFRTSAIFKDFETFCFLSAELFASHKSLVSTKKEKVKARHISNKNEKHTVAAMPVHEIPLYVRINKRNVYYNEHTTSRKNPRYCLIRPQQ